jgi:hypothetical protein
MTARLPPENRFGITLRLTAVPVRREHRPQRQGRVETGRRVAG